MHDNVLFFAEYATEDRWAIKSFNNKEKDHHLQISITNIEIKFTFSLNEKRLYKHL